MIIRSVTLNDSIVSLECLFKWKHVESIKFNSTSLIMKCDIIVNIKVVTNCAFSRGDHYPY